MVAVRFFFSFYGNLSFRALIFRQNLLSVLSRTELTTLVLMPTNKMDVNAALSRTTP